MNGLDRAPATARARAAIAAAIGASIAGLFACGTDNGGARQPQAPLAPTTSAATASIASAAASSVAAWVHVTPKAGEPSISCGDETCRAEDEVCCTRSGKCAKRVVPKTAGSFEEIGPQYKTCPDGPPKFCEDSSQCGAGETCCRDYYTSDADLIHCTKGGCAYDELCVDGGRCNTPRTSCVGGSCKRTDVKCGKANCAKGTSCCNLGGKLGCPASCSPDAGIECTKSADCPGNTKCQSSAGRTYCSAIVDIANAILVCVADVECVDADVCRFSGHTKPVCRKGTLFNTCACP